MTPRPLRLRKLNPKSLGEESFALQLRHEKIEAVREYQFYEPRKWRFDFVILPHRIAVEIEGGTWSGGRHTRGSGYEKDLEKYNVAAAEGWRVLRFTTAQATSGAALAFLKEALKP